MNLVDVKSGGSPLILAMPHTGLFIPGDVKEKLNENGLSLADTDWHIEELYQGLAPQATAVRALFHRYVIDANRDPSDESLYPGQNTTALCPTTDFNGEPIYAKGREPEETEIEHRRKVYHAPYHAALRAEIARIYNRFGIAVLFDCHSIRSKIPYLFEDTLPDFNIGTYNSATCAGSMEQIVVDICSRADGFTYALNGRFKGGWTTRRYGRPQNGIHAIQMELAQNTYLESQCAPFDYARAKAAQLRPYLQKIIAELTDWALENSEKGSP